jgi:hypothetical protein
MTAFSEKLRMNDTAAPDTVTSNDMSELFQEMPEFEPLDFAPPRPFVHPNTQPRWFLVSHAVHVKPNRMAALRATDGKMPRTRVVRK